MSSLERADLLHLPCITRAPFGSNQEPGETGGQGWGGMDRYKHRSEAGITHAGSLRPAGPAQGDVLV